MTTLETTAAASSKRIRGAFVASWAGIVGPILFVLVFLVEGATRPGYSVWRNFVSDLSMSDQGWMQVANFLVCGVLMLAFAPGLRGALRSGPGSLAGPLLLGLFGFSLVVAGLFTTDPHLGYPPGTPAVASQTLHGMLHGLAGLLAFMSLAAAALVLARRFARVPQMRRWALYSALTGIVIVAGFVVMTVLSVLDERGIMPNAPIGIVQRCVIIAGWSWVALVARRTAKGEKV